MQSLKFEMISLIFDPAASHTFFKLSRAIEYWPKTRNFYLEAKQMICSTDMFNIVFPTQEWYRRKNEIKILYTNQIA